MEPFYMQFPAGLWTSLSDLATTYQSKYAIGQQVFIMRDNKIVSGRIVLISLSDYEDDKSCMLIIILEI